MFNGLLLLALAFVVTLPNPAFAVLSKETRSSLIAGDLVVEIDLKID